MFGTSDPVSPCPNAPTIPQALAASPHHPEYDKLNPCQTHKWQMRILLSVKTRFQLHPRWSYPPHRLKNSIEGKMIVNKFVQ